MRAAAGYVKGVVLILLAMSAALPAMAAPPASARVGTGVDAAVATAGRARVVIALATSDTSARTSATGHSPHALQTRVEGLAGPSGLEVVHRYSVLPALAGWVSAGGLAVLRSDPSVLRIDLDAPGSGQLGQSVPLIGADLLGSVYGLTGAGVTIAVLDSGMDPNHPDLASALTGEQCFCSGGGGCCPNGSSAQSGPGAGRDDHFHGTHVTSIITGDGVLAAPGVAPSASIVAVKVLDSGNRFCCTSDVVAGLDWILANRPDVDLVNMSLGTFAAFAGDCDGATAFTMLFADAIDRLTEDGVTVFAASGNTSNAGFMKAPGCVANAISVGATNKSDAIALFSGGGPTLDLLAPGVDILAARKGGGTRTLSGTSMASPHAAGAAALLLEAQPRLTPERVLQALTETGVELQDSRNGLVFARVDAEAALLSLEVCDDGADNDADDLVDVEDPDCPAVAIAVLSRVRQSCRVASRRRGFARPGVRVALLGAEDLDVLDVDIATLELGPGGAPPRHDLTDPDVLEWHLRDVDRDGFTDLLGHFDLRGADLCPDPTEVCLAGSLFSTGEVFRTCDDVMRPRHPRPGPGRPW